MADRHDPSEAEQARRLAQYDDLVRRSTAVDAEPTFEELLDLLAREAARLMQADRSSIFLLNPERDELWSRVALGVGDQDIRFRADRGIAGHVVKTGEVLNIPEPYADLRFNPEVDRQTGYRTRSILCAPLRTREGRVIGALQVLNKLDGGPFTAEDERLVEALAARCATVIENALVYEQLRAAEQRWAEPASAMPKLLVADDDPTLAGVVAEALEDDFQVVQALDGEEALAKAEAERPDVVLLDISMPRKDGLETCRALRASAAGRDVPIIMVTASSRPEDAIGAFEVGANDYLAKPFSLSQLRAKAQTWLLRTVRPGT